MVIRDSHSAAQHKVNWKGCAGLVRPVCGIWQQLHDDRGAFQGNNREDAVARKAVRLHGAQVIELRPAHRYATPAQCLYMWLCRRTICSAKVLVQCNHGAHVRCGIWMMSLMVDSCIHTWHNGVTAWCCVSRPALNRAHGAPDSFWRLEDSLAAYKEHFLYELAHMQLQVAQRTQSCWPDALSCMKTSIVTALSCTPASAM